MTGATVDVAQLDDRSLLGAMFGLEDLSLADHLLKAFGGLTGVVNASGMKLEAEARRNGQKLPIEALQMDAVREATARCLRSRVHDRHRITSRSQLYAYLRVTLAAVGREQMRVLYLDQSSGLIAEEGTMGSVDHAPFYPREVLRRALELEASRLILAHNHPSRSASFSREDIRLTKQLRIAAEAVGIELVDHLLVCGHRIVSAAEQGALPMAA